MTQSTRVMEQGVSVLLDDGQIIVIGQDAKTRQLRTGGACFLWLEAASAPVLMAPTITLDPVVAARTVGEQPLLAVAAQASGFPSPSINYQWKLDGANIAANYTLQSGDAGSLLTVLATATNSEGSDTATSAAVTVQAAAATLNALSGTFTLAENSAQGTVAGAINGATSGSSLSLTNNAGGRVALSGFNIVAGATALDFETGTSHSFTVSETLPGATNTPRETVLSLTVTNVLEASSLQALTLSPSSITNGQAVSITINNRRAGSTINVSTGSLPAGLTLNSAAGTITGTSTVNGTVNFSLVETLADSPNSPRSSALSIVTQTAADTTAPTITSANPSGTFPENQAISGTVTANEAATFSVTGDDASLVTINSSSGDWSIPTPDFDTKSSYSWSFTATDAAGNVGTQAVAITITDVAAPAAPGYLDATVVPYAAYGPQRMVSGYSGPLFTLRRDDGATLDVTPQAGGDYPDYAAIDAWAGAAIPTVATLHDQSGNGRHLTQANAANQPSFDTTQRFGNAVPILFDGFGRTATAANPQRERTLSVGSLTGLDAVSMSTFMAMGPQTSYNSTGHWFGSNEAGSTGRHEQLHGVTANALTNRVSGTNRNVNPATLGPMVRATPNVIGGAVDGAGVLRQWANGTTGVTGGVSTTPNLIERLTLGKTLIGGAPYFGAYRLFGWGLYSSGVSEANGNAIVASLNTAFGFGAAPEYNVALIGDSITEGTGSRLIRNIPSLLDFGLTKPRRIHNMGVHGERLSLQFTQRAARYTTTFASGIPNVAFIQSGTNDIGAGTTGAALYADNTTPMVAFLQGLGFDVIVCTLLPRVDGPWSPTLETERLAYNALVTDNSAGADAVLNLTANAVMGPVASASDTALYPDNLHPSSLGYAWLAGAPSGTYSAANTYYDTLRTVLRTTALGASYVP